MLVKKSIVQEWYKTTSWVYKNFAYLFVNPLWNTKIPNGFSVCPYFWLSILSLTIFRPFVVIVKYMVNPLINLCGKPAKYLDNQCKHILCDKWGVLDENKKSVTGIGITIGTLTIATVTLGLIFIGLLCHSAYTFYVSTNYDKDLLCIFTLVSSFIWFPILASVYSLIRGKKFVDVIDNDISKTAYGIVLSAVMLTFFPYTIWSLIKNLFISIGTVSAAVAGYIWSGITITADFIWGGIKYAPIPELYVPWWAYLLLLGGIAYIYDKLLTKYYENISVPLPTDEEIRTKNQQAWLAVYMDVINNGYFFADATAFNFNEFMTILPTKDSRTAAKIIRNKIFHEAITKILDAKVLTEMGNTKPKLDKNYQMYLKNYTPRHILNQFDWLVTNGNMGNNIDVDELFKAVMEVMQTPEIRSELSEIERELELSRKHAIDRKQRMENSFLYKATEAVGVTISNAAASIINTITWLAKQSWTLLVYLWMFLKAKKQGACPYFKFEKNDDDVTTNG